MCVMKTRLQEISSISETWGFEAGKITYFHNEIAGEFHGEVYLISCFTPPLKVLKVATGYIGEVRCFFFGFFFKFERCGFFS